MEISINKKTVKIIGIVLLSILALVIIQALVKGNNKDEGDINGNKDQKIIADKIEVVHFHATQQCWSCVKVGEYTEKSLKIRFPKELESGRVKFKSINIDLPENSEIKKKYKAYGSSLFINLIYDDQDHISEDVNVWRLINSEIQFRKYLGDKLEKYL